LQLHTFPENSALDEETERADRENETGGNIGEIDCLPRADYFVTSKPRHHLRFQLSFQPKGRDGDYTLTWIGGRNNLVVLKRRQLHAQCRICKCEDRAEMHSAHFGQPACFAATSLRCGSSSKQFIFKHAADRSVNMFESYTRDCHRAQARDELLVNQ